MEGVASSSESYGSTPNVNFNIQNSLGIRQNAAPTQNVAEEDNEEIVQIRIDDTCITLPTTLMKNKDVFDEFLKLNPLSHVSEAKQQCLKSRLPSNYSEDDLKKLFDPSENFHFGHPLENFRRQISGKHVLLINMALFLYYFYLIFLLFLDGWYDAGGYTERQQLRDHIRVWYDHFIRRHYVQLLKTLLQSRRKLIDASAHVQDSDSVFVEPIVDKHANRKMMIRRRAQKRCRYMLADVKQQVGETGISSDDEDIVSVPSTKPAVPSTGETTVSNSTIKDVGLYQPLELNDVNELFSSFLDLKHFQPDHPSLDFSGMDMEDIIERSGLEAMAERVGLMPNRCAKNEAAKCKAKNANKVPTN